MPWVTNRWRVWMAFDSTLLTAIADALSPPKILGMIRNYISPVLNFVDSQLGYDDFELCYRKPEEAEIYPKMVYLYQEEGKLYCLTKAIAIENPIELLPEDLGIEAFNGIVASLKDVDKKTPLDIKTKSILYDFLIHNKVEVGFKATWHKKVRERYHKIEANFIAKNPRIYRAYLSFKNLVNDACTFAVSQTGLRIASVASTIGIAVASGGMIPVIMAGAYTASIGISIVQQAYSKLKLNRLSEEAILLERYKKIT